MDDKIYIYLKEVLKDRLINDLKKDNDFKKLNIDNLIETRVNIILDGDINFDNINYQSLLYNIFGKYNISERQIKEKINDIINNPEAYQYIMIMLNYILVSKDNSILVVEDMDKLDNMFQETFKKVFNEKINNKQALKVKKCRLRKKILNNEDPDKQDRKDYEYIMFKYIMDMSYNISF